MNRPLLRGADYSSAVRGNRGEEFAAAAGKRTCHTYRCSRMNQQEERWVASLQKLMGMMHDYALPQRVTCFAF